MIDQIFTRLDTLLNTKGKSTTFYRLFTFLSFFTAVNVGFYTFFQDKSETVLFVKIFFGFTYGAMTWISMYLVVAVLAVTAMYWKEDNKQKIQKDILAKETDDDTDVSELPDEDELTHACVRLNHFLKTVNYRQMNVPIGIRFEDRSRGNCYIQWSLDPKVEPMRIASAGFELNKIIDRLQLEMAIPVDENAPYTAP